MLESFQQYTSLFNLQRPVSRKNIDLTGLPLQYLLLDQEYFEPRPHFPHWINWRQLWTKIVEHNQHNEVSYKVQLFYQPRKKNDQVNTQAHIGYISFNFYLGNYLIVTVAVNAQKVHQFFTCLSCQHQFLTFFQTIDSTTQSLNTFHNQSLKLSNQLMHLTLEILTIFSEIPWCLKVQFCCFKILGFWQPSSPWQLFCID